MSKHGDPDAQVDEFLELEQELSSGHKTRRTYEQGNVAEAAKIPASEVPDDYPVPIETRRALQLNVETPDGETVATYLEWPEEGEESDHIDQLLDALGRSHDEFANVYGDRVALAAEDGWHGIDAEKTAAMRGAERASGDDSLDTSRNLVAGAVALGALGFVLTQPLATVGAWLAILSWAAVPATIYYDANRVEDATGWSPETTRWVVGGFVPIFNVSVGLAYLVDRHVRLSGTAPGEVSETWFKGVLVGLLAPLVGTGLVLVSTAVGALVFFYGALFLPFAVYFDAEYVEDATDWDPNEELWAVASLFLGPLAGGAYLLRRSQALD
ncbi:hypothetical protein [Halorussus salinus]|uniref:hypothetical protein n=1 Tax=Halorussus salinus TaxID=1364935 RepID=UPI001092E844|nr:hypothetical protein [Halorussus salinus]